MEFYFPTETGEQLAFASAALFALLGLFIMFAPVITLRGLGLSGREGREGLAALRLGGGMMAGLGASAVMLAQPMLYLAYGITLGVGLFGLILSILSDHGGARGATWRNFLLIIAVTVLGVLPFIYVFGLV
ncbi:DUF4345 domain-containing protein [Agrobacterium vitis]|uniref:DUF4345 domain-containing protein n=1 Tax=Agrobacterium vitis TaxID=373 RepID=UPI0012E8575A|nr:DUF4345 domain-containing protein [Agrobacterium vitis]MVA25501.1 DUF4345 domain-containing protein [Agrobacterium vitis]